MDFYEKIKKIRTDNNMTQEQFAEKLYVSRTAVSKWESGKGYPSIDSLKYISKLFNISIDELLSSEEILDIAENENVYNINKFNNLVYSLLDMMSVLYIFFPLYGQKIGEVFYSVSLLSCNNMENNIKIIYILALSVLTLFGLFELILNFIDNKRLRNIINIISIIVQSISVLFFILSRQPYLTSIIFMVLLIKISIIIKENFDKKKLL